MLKENDTVINTDHKHVATIISSHVAVNDGINHVHLNPWTKMSPN